MKIFLRWSVALLAVLALGGCSRRDAETLDSTEAAEHAPFPCRSDDTRVRGCVRTSSGEVWAVSYNSCVLMVREGEKWIAKHEFEKLYFQSFVMDDLDRIWIFFKNYNSDRNAKESYSVARYDTRARRLDFMKPAPSDFEKNSTSSSSMFVLSKDLQGRVWLSGKISHVYRFDEDGTAQLVARLDGKVIVKSSQPYHAVHRLLFEPDGAIWLWSEADRANSRFLKRPLRLDGETPELMPETADLPEGFFYDLAAVTVGGEREWWVSIAGKGIWRMPAGGGGTARKVEFPKDSMRSRYSRIFAAHGRVFVVRYITNSGDESKPLDRRTCELWVWGTGKTEKGGPATGNSGSSGEDVKGGDTWRRVIDYLDDGGSNYRRAVVETDEGLWLGTNYKGIWFVPKDEPAKPRHFDWRQGFSVAQTEGFLSLPEGRLLAFKNDGGICVIDIAELLAYKTRKPNIDIVYDTQLTGKSFVMTKSQDGTVYLFEQPSRTLYRWDGRKLVECAACPDHPITKEGRGHDYLATDSLDRVWVIPQKHDEPAFVLDTKTGKWSEPRPYRELLEERARGDGSWHFLPQCISTSTTRDAVFTDSGQAAFATRSRELAFFDGLWWRTIDMGGGYIGLGKDPDTGEILVSSNSNGEASRVDALGEMVKSDARFPFLPGAIMAGRPKVDGEWENCSGLRYVADEGDGWLFGKGMLWRVKDGHVLAWFAEGEPHPFISQGSYYWGVTEDNFGNYLFFYSNRMVRVPRHLPSEFALAGKIVANSDNALVHIGGVEGNRVRTRLNDEEWTDWELAKEHTKSVEYKRLLPGDYQIEVQVMNKYLEVSPTRQLEFTIKYDIDKPAHEAVEKLFGENWNERNEAVKTLQRHPERARVLLTQLDRAKLDSNDRWWLDAALQQLEERK